MPAYINISEYNAVNDLTRAIDQISKIPLTESSDPSRDPFGLALHGVVITPPIIRLLVRILNLRLPKSLDATTERKWDSISFCDCRVTRQRAIVLDAQEEDRCCSPDDERLLAATLARRLLSLGIARSPEILDCLLHAPKLENADLSLDQVSWSALQCEGFGNLIQRSVRLKNLTIIGPSNLEEPQIFVECLANSSHLQKIRVFAMFRVNQFVQRDPALNAVLAGGQGLVVRMLQNSQSRLRTLHLAGIQLQDEHFMAIVDTLPTSKLEELYVQNNNIQRTGILAFAKQLPRIKWLQQVALFSNPWETRRNGFEECGTAILEGMLGNYSIVFMNIWKRSPQVKLVDLYCYLNWAGRRLLATSSQIPLGLWPLVLERVWGDNDNQDNGNAGSAGRQDNDNVGNGSRQNTSDDASTGSQDNNSSDDTSTGSQDNNNSDSASTGSQDNNNSDDASTGSRDKNNSDGASTGSQDNSNSDEASTGSQDNDYINDGSSGSQDNKNNGNASTRSHDNTNSDDASTGGQDIRNSDDGSNARQDDDINDDESTSTGGQDNNINDDESTGSQDNDYSDDESTESQQDFRPDAIFMFLRNSPILSSVHSSYSLENRPGKKMKVRE